MTAALLDVLGRARALGFLGPGPVEDHVSHAAQFGRALDTASGSRPDHAAGGAVPAADGPGPGSGSGVAGTGGSSAGGSGAGDAAGVAAGDATLRIADIGAGGGVPSLPVLVARPSVSAVLIDAAQKRCSFLVWAVAELGLAERVEVWCDRAERIGHQERARGRFDAVLARGFGPPAVTLECAAPLLVDGGLVVVSEPPVPRHWPAEGLAGLGLRQRPQPPGTGVAVFERTGDLPEHLPRTAKQLQRWPLFEVD